MRSWSAPCTPSMPTSSTGRHPADGPRGSASVSAVVAHEALRPRGGAAGQQHGALLQRAALRHHAGVVAGIALLLVRARRAPRRSRSGRGRRTGRRSPSAARRTPAPPTCACATTRRSARAAASWEWITATKSPKRSTNRPAVCGVSAISGTSTMAERPRSSAIATDRRYTSVFPLPVTPSSSSGVPGRRPRPAAPPPPPGPRSGPAWAPERRRPRRPPRRSRPPARLEGLAELHEAAALQAAQGAVVAARVPAQGRRAERPGRERPQRGLLARARAAPRPRAR